MTTFLTQVEINGKTLAGPNIEAGSFEEADEIAEKEYNNMYEVIGELVWEINVT